MANNYVQFSFGFNLSPAACEWAESLLFKAQDSEGYDLKDDAAKEAFPDWDDNGQEIGFDWEIEANDLHAEGKTIYTMVIYTEESGNPDNVRTFLQAYLRKFDPGRKIWFSYACTCSKPRPDEFGGGALVVSATDCDSIDTWTWLRERT